MNSLDVYQALVNRGTAPALTWYGPDGRMELSGKVAANHMAKIAGYLADEVWLDEGASLLLDLPSHWKTCLWGLGGMLAGLEVEVGGAADIPDAVLTNRPESAPDADNTIALDLGPLALSWMGDPLAPGIFDGSAEVMGSPDQLMDNARHASGNFAHWEAQGILTPAADRLMISGAIASNPASTLAAVAWQLGRGSVVVLQNETIPAKVAETEGATPAELLA
ncbi:TIGR03089 family protein [Ancrocorticia populi]|uniref:TIGR03089 family protein n=1 Tax=Ancrocorticia populi TaxID=2175228 RepID=UPI003F9895B3